MNVADAVVHCTDPLACNDMLRCRHEMRRVIKLLIEVLRQLVAFTAPAFLLLCPAEYYDRC